MPRPQPSPTFRFSRAITLLAVGVAILLAAPRPGQSADQAASAPTLATEAPADAAITAHIKQTLHSELPTESRDVIVRTRDAHAHLYGIVDSDADKRNASRIAADAPGVVHVANHLTVSRPWKQKSDDAIQKELEQKLTWTFATGAEQISVTVEEGVAILNGSVHTWMEWQKAMELAFEAGARRPHNLLNVHRDGDHPSPQMYVPK